MLIGLVAYAMGVIPVQKGNIDGIHLFFSVQENERTLEKRLGIMLLQLCTNKKIDLQTYTVSKCRPLAFK